MTFIKSEEPHSGVSVGASPVRVPVPVAVLPLSLQVKTGEEFQLGLSLTSDPST